MKSHIENEALSIDALTEELVDLAAALDHKHRQQRKIQFFLDVRGYFVANRIKGAYMEFGLYRGEMMFSAHHVLDGTGCLTRYVGLDTFAGEPAYTAEEQASMPILKPGDFSSDYATTKDFLDRRIGADKVTLIKGDFRAPEVQAQVTENAPVAIGVVDCNIASSIEAALTALLPAIAPCGFLFMDDLFANAGNGRLETNDMVMDMAAKAGRTLVEYQTYPPCSRAYVVI